MRFSSLASFIGHASVPALGLLLFSSIDQGVAAQNGRMMVFETDDGGEMPQVMHVASPDIRELKKPDYVRTDLPVFNEKLTLDDVQQMIVKSLLEAYLAEFDTKIVKALPESPALALPLHFGDHPLPDGAHDDHDHGHGEGVEVDLHSLLDGAFGGGGTVDMDVEALPSGSSIGITIQAGTGGDDAQGGGGDGGDMVQPAGVIVAGTAGGEGDEGDTPTAGVFIGMSTPDDAEIPEEVRQQLEQKAQEIAEKIQKQIEKQMEDGDGEATIIGAPFGRMEDHIARMEEMAATADDLESVKDALRRKFEQDVQAQLTPDQMTSWPSLERTLTRKKTLPLGRLDGEKTDLIAIVEAMSLEEADRVTLREKLDSYERDLHDALVRRNDYVQDASKKVEEALKDGRHDRALTISDKAADFRVAVRTVNLQYKDTIAEGLDEEFGTRFQDAVLRESFPGVYQRTRAQRAMEEARALEDVDPEILAVIDEMEEAYLLERERIDADLRLAILRHQPAESRRGIESVKKIMEGGEVNFNMHEDDPVHKAYRKRTDFDEEFMKRLYALFTPEQVESLPKLPSAARRQPMIFELK